MAFDRDRILSAAGTTLVLAESPDGTATPLLESLPPDWAVTRAAGAAVTRAKVGGVADELQLDGGPYRAVVVEDAQWADPTSLGRLQRLVTEATEPLLVVVAHRPVEGVDAWWLDQFADAGRLAGDVYRVELEPTEADALTPLPTEPAERDLVLAAGLLCESMSVPVLARLLGTPEPQALDVAEKLAAEGWLRQTRAGFYPARPGVLSSAGEARIGHIASRLAEAIEESGGSPAVVGNLLLAADDPAAAYPRLRTAATEAEAGRATGEAFHLAESALAAARDGETGDRSDLGQLHLMAARFLRSAGRSASATEHLDEAVAMLEGVARIDALGFAAAVADDRQHPQDSETILAAAEWEAVRQGEAGKLGSLSSLRARSLHRIGFTEEADAMLEKATAILGEVGSAQQQYFSAVNRAWIHFDRGEAAVAETEFARLRDRAGEIEGAHAVADKEAWLARALFATGKPAEALEAVARAEELAEREGVEAPLFLANLALSEGALLLQRYEDALVGAERVSDLVERQLPSWKNIAHHNRAAALAGLGRLAEAREQIDAALAATPDGANGWRWRLRSRALELEISTAEGTPWPKQEAEDLADLMLHSHFYGWAAELMTVIAEQTRRKDFAREAMALALQIGNPMVAARAASAGSLWREDAAAPAVAAIHTMRASMPPEWASEWVELASVSEALAVPKPQDDRLLTVDTDALDKALRRAGLAGADVILSPAQRRGKGLTRRRRSLSPLQMVAAGLAVVVLAGSTSYAIAELRPEPTPGTVIVQVSSPTETTVPTLENTRIELPEGVQLVGTAEHRGGAARTGVFEAAGPQTVNGYYWRVPVADAIDASPIAYGNNLLVGVTDGTFYALDQTTGKVAWQFSAQDRISTAPALGQGSFGEGNTQAMVIVAGDDGVVRAREAVSADVQPIWTPQVGTRIRSAPVVGDGIVMVATSDGFVHGLGLVDGAELWTYPAEGEGLGPISADLAYADGFLYVGTEQSGLHVVNAADGTYVCDHNMNVSPILANPVVAGGAVYVPTQARTIFVFPAGTCQGQVPGRLPWYPTETPVNLAPAIVGDVMFLAEGLFLYKLDLVWNDGDEPRDRHLWAPTTVMASEPISTPPVVAGDTVYFGTEDGLAIAVDSETGEERWRWQTGQYVRGAPVVVDGAVFIVSGDGTVTAVGE